MKSRNSKKKESWCLSCHKKPQTMDSDLSDQETEYYIKVKELVIDQNNFKGKSKTLFMICYRDFLTIAIFCVKYINN